MDALAVVKAWQASFRIANGRAPEKADVHAVCLGDSVLGDAYRAIRALRDSSGQKTLCNSVTAPPSGSVGGIPLPGAIPEAATSKSASASVGAPAPPLSLQAASPEICAPPRSRPYRPTLAELLAPPAAPEPKKVDNARHKHHKTPGASAYGFAGGLVASAASKPISTTPIVVPTPLLPKASAAQHAPLKPTATSIDSAAAAACGGTVEAAHFRPLEEAMGSRRVDARQSRKSGAISMAASGSLGTEGPFDDSSAPSDLKISARATDMRVATSDNFVTSDYRRKYRCARRLLHVVVLLLHIQRCLFNRSKGVKRRRVNPGARRSAPCVAEERAGEGDERHLNVGFGGISGDEKVVGSDSSLSENGESDGSAGDASDMERVAYADSTNAAPTLLRGAEEGGFDAVGRQDVYVADMLRMEKAAGGGGGRRFGSFRRGSDAVVGMRQAGATSSIDRAGADADVLDVCMDAIEVAAAHSHPRTCGSAPDGDPPSSSRMPPPATHLAESVSNVVPVIAEAAGTAAGLLAPRRTAALVASSAVGAVTGLQYSERGLPLCSGHRMECRARKVRRFLYPFNPKLS